jgi:dTDP-4-dehydrorhamnose reductase
MSSDKPRVLVIGSRGFLGEYVSQALAEEYDVIPANRILEGRPGEVLMDVKDVGSVKSAFRLARPNVVVLLAAHSDIDYCERFPEEARAVNANGAEYVAEASADSNVRLVFTSTGAVFDGKKHGYTETDEVSPVSVYGETKARAEEAALRLGSSAIVLRIALALGFTKNPARSAVLDNLKSKLAAGENVAMPAFEWRNPIDGGTFARFVADLLRDSANAGIFHVGSQDSQSRYEIGVKLAARMGYAGRVIPQNEPIPGRAPRGADHYLLTDKLQKTCATPIPTCDQVIERCF